MNAARIRRGVYICNICKKEIARKDVALDHIDPIVDPVKGFIDWNTYIDRMFPQESGFQVLCKDPCHKAKTKAENLIRKLNRPKKKLAIKKKKKYNRR